MTQHQPTARFYNLASYFRQRYGQPIRKISLDAGASCPNRDGLLSHGGCAFCNPHGAGPGPRVAGLDLRAQWERVHSRFASLGKRCAFLAYLQAFSNTYMDPAALGRLLDETAALPDAVGLAIGTRPDCLDDEKLDRIAAMRHRLGDEIWLDLGLQTANDATLRRINRGHDLACWRNAVHAAAARGIRVCAHVMAGLPGETREDFLHTVTTACAAPIAGVKFHNLLVTRGTAMALEHAADRYHPLSLEDYAAMLGEALELTPREIVVHRLHADPAPGELIAPSWAADKQAVRRLLDAHFEAADIRQGRRASDSGPDREQAPAMRTISK